MTLNRDLYDRALSSACDFCGHELIKPGRWFATLRGSFTCEACFQKNPFGYEQKSRLFDRHARRLLSRIDRTLMGQRRSGGSPS